MSYINNLFSHINLPQLIIDMPHCNNGRVFIKKGSILLPYKIPVIIDGNNPDLSAVLLSNYLPGNNICMMFYFRNNNLIALRNKLLPKAMGHKVNTIRGTRRIDYFMQVFR